jgi:hypothetical protein
MKAPPVDAPEWQIQAYVKQEIEKLGLVVAEVNYTSGKPTGTHTTPGFPDLVVIGRRQVHLWECKGSEGRLTPVQAAFHTKCAQSGYYIPVIRSLDDALLFYSRQFHR